jgi:hypothetical protein
MWYNGPEPERKQRKDDTANRRLANPYAKVNATRRTANMRLEANAVAKRFLI